MIQITAFTCNCGYHVEGETSSEAMQRHASNGTCGQYPNHPWVQLKAWLESLAEDQREAGMIDETDVLRKMREIEAKS